VSVARWLTDVQHRAIWASCGVPLHSRSGDHAGRGVGVIYWRPFGQWSGLALGFEIQILGPALTDQRRRASSAASSIASAG